VAFVALVAALAALPGVAEAAGAQVMSISSGSMAPAFPSGSLVLIRPVDAGDVVPGDVIVFHSAQGWLVTHRVVAVDGADAVAGGVVFVTRGDAAPAPDAEPVPPANVVGRVAFGVPWLGELRAWLFAPLGACAVALAAVLLARGARRT